MGEYKEIYNNEQYKRCSRVIKGKFGRRAGDLEGWGSRQSADDLCFLCTFLISNQKNPQAPYSKIKTCRSRGVRTPQRVVW